MNIEQVVREVTVRGSVQGMDQVARAYDQVSAAAGRTATVTDITTKSQISAEAAVERLRARYQEGYRAQQQYIEAQKTYQRAVDQGRVSQQAAAAELANIQAKLGQLSSTQKATALATQNLQLQMAAFAGGLGLVGQFLTAFGPAGFAAAVGLGAVQSALSLASDKAHQLAQKSKEIFEFSEATGLTTRQFQALRSEAGKFGVDSETLASGLTKFTVGFEELRKGSGALLEQVRRIDPALAEQMQRTTDSATAFTLFGKAVEQTSNIFERNALLKAGMGRGAATFGAFFESAPDVAKLTASFDAAGKGIEANLINKLRQLEIDINKTKSAASTVFATMFGTGTLEGELEFQRGLLSIATTLASMKISDDLRKFLDVLTNPITLTVVAAMAGIGAIALGPTVGGVALAVGAAGAGAGAIVGGIKSAGGGTPAPAAATPPAAAPAGETGTGGKLAPEAEAAKIKDLVSVLGSAATPAQRLAASIADLEIKAAQAGQRGLIPLATAALRLESSLATAGARAGAMGASLPVQDAVNKRMMELQQLQQQGAGLTGKQIADQISLAREQALGTAQIKNQIDAVNVQAATIGMSAGAAAAYTAKQTLLNEALRNHKDLTAADIAEIDKQAEALGRAVQAGALRSAQSQVDFTSKTLFMSQADLAAAQVMHNIYGDEWQSHMDDALAKQIKMNALISDVRDTSQQFTSDLVKGLMSGTSLMSSLGNAAQNLSNKMADKALTSLFSGDFVSAGIQGTIAVASSWFASNQKQKEQDEKARAEWEKQAFAYNEFLSVMTGQGKGGDLTQSFQQMSSQLRSLMEAADKAKDTIAFNALAVASIQYQIAESQKFMSTFRATLAGFADGLGPNSPFLSAVEGVGQALDKVQSYIVDTRTALNILFGSSNNGMTADLASDSDRGKINAQVNEASAAAQRYLVSLLQTAPELSAVQSGLLTINGTATALQGALERLGMSSADAARAINDGVTKAIAALRSTFESGLTSRLNTANGKGYLNDAAALIRQNIQDQADAAALGTDAALVSAVFRAEAQKIVDDAGLIGDAFTDFTTQFPALASVVTQSSDALAAAAKQQQDALNSSAKNILDYVNGLTAGSSSTLSPSDRLAAAQSAYNAKLVLAQAGNADAQGSIATDAENLRSAARDMYGSTTAYQSVLSQITSQLLALPAVQATTDPVLVVMRDVLSAIAAQTLTQATDATLIGTIKAAIDAGNAAATATALSTYFNQIDTNTSQSIDFNEMKAALGGMASDAGLRDMFTRLDQDNSGAIDRLELIKAASQNVAGTNYTISAVAGSINSNTASTNSGIDQGNAKADITNAWLDQIRQLNATSATQLSLLQTVLAASPTITYSAWNANTQSFQTGTSNSNSMLTALGKIVVNTAATAANTAATLGRGSLISYQLATGGYVTGPGTSTSDSIPAWLSNGEGIINAAATAGLGGRSAIDNLNAGRIPVMPVPVALRATNDNGDLREVLAELRAVKAELAAIKANTGRTVGAVTEGAQYVRDGLDKGNALQSDNNKLLRR